MATRSDTIGAYRAAHPGRLVSHWLEEEGLKKKDLAEKMGIPQSRFSEFLHGKRDMTEALAVKLSENLGMDADYWMRLQIQYDYDERMFSLKEQDKRQVTMHTSLKVDSGKQFMFHMNIYVYEDKGQYFAYLPSLDIIASGESFNDAVSKIYNDFQASIENSIANDTLEENLSSHGWKLQSDRIEVPEDSLDNPHLRKIFYGDISYTRVQLPMCIAV